ncbi:hypothetical protein H0H93_016759 [Arthromyces matolae]|nr:hypothetical protein H0H93_016759 [Arthromyces matolae]
MEIHFIQFWDGNGVPVPFCVINKGRYCCHFVNKRELREYYTTTQGLTGTALEEWLILKHAQYNARKEHAKQGEEWNMNRNLQRTNKLDDLRKQRYQAIIEKLSELGWEKEIDYMESGDFDDELLSELKVVKQPKVLTDRIWANIKDSLIEYMTDVRAERLAKLREKTIFERGGVLSKAIEVYAATHGLHDVLPHMVDVAMEPSFRAIIEDTPFEDEISTAHFQSCMNEFPRIAEESRCTKDKILIELINDDPNAKETATLTTLQRATTFFHCQRCRHTISYPRVLFHDCMSFLYRPSNPDENPYNDPYLNALGSSGRHHPWNYKNSTIRYDSAASEQARLILQHSQLDPAIPVDALNELDLRFECLECGRLPIHNPSRVIMKWPNVIEHLTHTIHRYQSDATYKVERAVLTPSEKSFVDMQEPVEKSRAFKEKCRFFLCDMICRECKGKVNWLESYGHLIDQ